MKAIYFPTIPVDLESAATPAGRQPTIMGARVYLDGLFKALLKYSTYDRLFLPPLPPRPSGDMRDAPAFKENRGRIEYVHEHQLSKLQAYSPSVFLSWSTNLDGLARLRRVSGCTRASVAGIIHSLNYSFELKGVLSLLLAPLESQDALVCSSTAGKTTIERFVELLGERLDVVGWPRLARRFRLPIIPLGVETSDFAPTSTGESPLRQSLGLGSRPIVLYLGRFAIDSKADLYPLIVAFRQLHVAHPDAALVLAGDDTLFNIAEPLRQFASHVAPDACVRVVPNPDHRTKRQLYQTADVFVSPSDNLQETFGITVIEAMASGLPTVVSDWNGYKDLVLHGETGLRVRATLPEYEPRFEDVRGSGTMLSTDLLARTTMISVAGLSDALGALMADPGRRRCMGDAARARAKSLYDWSVVIGAYESLWAELAAEAARPGAPASVGIDLDRFSYRDVFSHYPTDSLAANHHVWLTTVHSDWPDWHDHLSSSTDDSVVFRRERFEPIIAELRGLASLEVRTLMTRLGNESESDRLLNMLHLCRLIKYGLVDCSQDAPQ